MGKRATRKNRAAAQGKFSYGVDRPPLSWLCSGYPLPLLETANSWARIISLRRKLRDRNILKYYDITIDSSSLLFYLFT